MAYSDVDELNGGKPMKSLFFTVLLLLMQFGCQSMSGSNMAGSASTAVSLPFIKNSPNECYYLDEFMPTPDNLVSGKSGHLSLRYYTFHNASFKDWNKRQITLSFYSVDERCWTLFEEYYTGDFR